MNPACLARLTLIQVLPLLLNHVLKTGGGLQGRTETRMCLLLKATDAKPKHSFSRLQRLLQTSIAECLQLDEPKHPFFLRLMHTKLFFLPLLSDSRQFASCQGFCCHCSCFTFGNQEPGCWRWSRIQLTTEPARTGITQQVPKHRGCASLRPHATRQALLLRQEKNIKTKKDSAHFCKAFRARQPWAAPRGKGKAVNLGR